MGKTIPTLLGGLLAAAILISSYLIINQPEIAGDSIKHVLRLAIVVWLLVLVSGLFVDFVIRSDRMSVVLKNIWTTLYMLAVVALILEAIFLFVPRSHGVGYTYGAKNWFFYHWKRNSLGYRDVEPEPDWANKPAIVVVGDSFTAGHGVENPENTFAGKLRELVADRYSVYSFGNNGADTRTAFNNLSNSPVEPSLLILQYYGNDIEKAGIDHGIVFEGFAPYDTLSNPMKALVGGSYLINYLYWRLPQGDTSSYRDFLEQTYQDPEVMATHFQDLRKFADYSRECGVPLLVVMFPFLWNLEDSQVYTIQVADFFNSVEVPVVNVGELVEDMPLTERMVNSNDAHASEDVHARVAETIQRRMGELGWLNGAVSDPSLKNSPACRSFTNAD